MAKLIPFQIYLPRQLRSEIDKMRKETGESLSAYMRQAVKERLEVTNNKADFPMKDIKIISP
ncbi:MAG: hypothetical protein G01um10147_289 [Microgenomates group bacterium Gr01-1014_7]|nr:MAG: hypothetical protein G01um10147_289 [Microgenomates group bacterium Gr01-1014_7]